MLRSVQSAGRSGSHRLFRDSLAAKVGQERFANAISQSAAGARGTSGCRDWGMDIGGCLRTPRFGSTEVYPDTLFGVSSLIYRYQWVWLCTQGICIKPAWMLAKIG